MMRIALLTVAACLAGAIGANAATSLDDNAGWPAVVKAVATPPAAQMQLARKGADDLLDHDVNDLNDNEGDNDVSEPAETHDNDVNHDGPNHDSNDNHGMGGSSNSGSGSGHSESGGSNSGKRG